MQQEIHDMGSTMSPDMTRSSYTMLGINLAVSLAIMYVGMFAMIYSLGEFIQNINFVYMALVMWAPMSSLMLLTMGSMYANKRLNIVLHAAFALVFVLSFVGIRKQGLVGNSQFLRSMIPHHSGAILMCEKATLTDPEIKRLCTGIIDGQKAEIAEMKALLAR